MAFLYPVAGYQATIAVYVMVGSVAALIWDILVHVDSDFKLLRLFKLKIGIPTVTYFISRISILVYVLLNVIFSNYQSRTLAAELPDCQVLEKIICAFYHITFSSTALLFFLRVRAFFNQNKYIIAFFALLWLAVLGSSLTAATVASAMHLGPTNYCVNAKLKPYASAAPITFAINDTFVFLCISWRLLSSALGRGRNSSIVSVILGNYLSAFSRALLHDGQVYYLVSVTSNIVAVIITWVGPLSYRLMFIIFNVTLTNMMACRVFRHTKLGDLREDAISTRWIASQLGHLDLEVGREHSKSPTDFLSVRTTENELDGSDAGWRGRELREPANIVITGEHEKGADGAPTEKT
ncbi:hypothetical protein C0993_002818 [Termitomyces sp. T159_Od127]|nr:hypothetical protein C0993_002818 [Termitomyces sp. T159_Od127]